MEKPQKMAQIYGYLVCLVAVITFLICATSLVNAVIDLSDPLVAAWKFSGEPSLASYENYKTDILSSSKKEGETSKAAYVPDEKTIHSMYEAAKNDKIQTVKHQSYRSIIVSGLLIVISIILFIIHWVWMQRLAKKEIQ